MNQASYFLYTVLEIQKPDTYLVMVACHHTRERLCLACDFLCFHMYLLFWGFWSWIKSETFQIWKIFPFVLSGCFFAPVDGNYILNIYILFINDSFAVMISRSLWYIAHPNPLCISTSSFPCFGSNAETQYPKSLSSVF